MRIIIGGLLLFITTGLLGQTTEWEKCGLNDSATLNQYEAKYFNAVFKDRKADFDFTGKIIAYYTGSSGTTKSKKSNYFRHLKYANNGEDKTIHDWQAGGTQLLILTEEEKAISGGYDVILVFWSKILKQDKSRARLIKRLKNTLPNKT